MGTLGLAEGRHKAAAQQTDQHMSISSVVHMACVKMERTCLCTCMLCRRGCWACVLRRMHAVPCAGSTGQERTGIIAIQKTDMD